MLCAAFAFTFGGVVAAAAVMGFTEDDEFAGEAERPASAIDASAAGARARRGRPAAPLRTSLKAETIDPLFSSGYGKSFALI